MPQGGYSPVVRMQEGGPERPGWDPCLAPLTAITLLVTPPHPPKSWSC